MADGTVCNGERFETNKALIQSGLLSDLYYCLFIGVLFVTSDFQGRVSRKLFACTVCTERSSGFPSANVHHLLGGSENTYSKGLINKHNFTPKMLCFWL